MLVKNEFAKAGVVLDCCLFDEQGYHRIVEIIFYEKKYDQSLSSTWL